MPTNSLTQRDFLYRLQIVIFNEENNIVLENIVVQKFLKHGESEVLRRHIIRYNQINPPFYLYVTDMTTYEPTQPLLQLFLIISTSERFLNAPDIYIPLSFSFKKSTNHDHRRIQRVLPWFTEFSLHFNLKHMESK